MSSTISLQALDSSSSDMTEPSTRYTAIIELGKKLVDELKLNDSVDTLGRWMAHYIAELLYDAEHSPDEIIRATKHAELRDSIWAFWVNRYELPIGNKSFQEAEPILRALQSLDPENEQRRYFSPAQELIDTEKEPDEVKKWLPIANHIDSTAKMLIDYCLSLAAENAIDKSKEWVELAQQAGLNEDIDMIELRIFRFLDNPVNKDDPTVVQRRVLEKRQKKLAAFLSLASQLDEQLKSELEALPASENGPTGDDTGV
ncbi:AVAST type 3 anti-phage proein Avs3b [Cronobacter sakazakii]|uniref:AVAST type 3 anti-phage proein Avs3b n=2 Tax=Cronobacter sakazakii TaxID=28141 RepID=UPI001054DEEE|nr:AVAST type 3 anti-phage proein Avs3b [Cronobacter sakazakii]